MSPRITRQILVIRGHKVMIDADLATLYGAPTKRLNEQVKRNARRFPADFVFQLSRAERDKVVAYCDHLQQLKFSRSRCPVEKSYLRSRRWARTIRSLMPS